MTISSKRPLKFLISEKKSKIEIWTPTISMIGTITAIILAFIALMCDNSTSKQITSRLEKTNEIWARNVEFDILTKRPKIGISRIIYRDSSLITLFSNNGYRDALDLSSTALMIFIKNGELFYSTTSHVFPYDLQCQSGNTLDYKMKKFVFYFDSIYFINYFDYRDKYINEFMHDIYSHLIVKKGNVYLSDHLVVDYKEIKKINNLLRSHHNVVLDTVFEYTVKDDYKVKLND